MENIETIFESLTSHPLVKTAFQNGVEITRSLELSRPAEVEVKYSRDPDEYEYYVITVGHTLAHLLGSSEQMMYAVHFLSTFSSTKKIKESRINRSNFIQYNIENYLIRTQSLNDRVLKLTNAVFHLGIDQRNCKFDTISKNLHVRASKIPARLKKLSEILGKYRQERNVVIHHESFQENDLRELELLYLVMEKSPDNDIQDMKSFAYHAKNLARDYVKQKKTEFDGFNRIAFNELFELFNSLEPKYIQMEKTLSIKCGHSAKIKSAHRLA